jgi:hypothetical protein
VVKRLAGGMALVGLALAAALVKGIYSKLLDALGWVGVAIGLGVFGLLIVLALALKSPSHPPEPPDSPAD